MIENPMEFLEKMKAVAEGHFVYKAGYKHGNLYVDKEKFSEIGANSLIDLIKRTVADAVAKGIKLGQGKEIGVIGPAYGAIPFSLAAAGALENWFPNKRFFPARTQLKEIDGHEAHYLPEKLIRKYYQKNFIIFEDIINNGTTCREVKQLFNTVAYANVLSVICFVNRAGQTADTLGVEEFYPLIDMALEQYDVRSEPCPLCQAKMLINTELGKGDRWVKMFGQPPYSEGTDFSEFWEKNKSN